MRILGSFILLLASALPAFSQQPAATAPGLPKDPREVFAAAAPYYGFSSSTLKPWHLKATYQLYDDNGTPTEQGTYEYWFASPQEYRSTWTRPGVTHTDWHADGKHAYRATGQPLKFFEYKLQSALLSPLPEAEDLDPAISRFDRENLSVGGAKVSCMMVIPLMPLQGHAQPVKLGLFPTYCFDTQLPVLRISYAFGAVTTAFNKIATVQGKYLAREIMLFEGTRKLLTAEVDSIDGLSLEDPALKPAPEVTSSDLKTVAIAGGISAGRILKKEAPIYPQDAKEAHISGTVLLRARIGADGGVHDLHVVSAPWPSLAAAALWSVSHWQYQPYLLNGEPVEVETTINIIFTLNR
jgi:TonB family protein